ncbi:MAG: DUF5067 domain-containing protein [Oscillospiraceae bacterium]|jgi:hypothetical protein|nr:DUF5067 domain-containing protein [Oscillospiraceae bacterium]
MPFCTECGATLPEEAAFCTNCGKRTDDISPPPPQPEQKKKGLSGGAIAAIVIGSILLLALLLILLLIPIIRDVIANVTDDYPSEFFTSTPGDNPDFPGFFDVPEIDIPEDGEFDYPFLPGGGSVSGSGYLDDETSYVSFIGAESFIDMDGDDAIRVYYDFTNFFESPRSAWSVLVWYANQDGKELDFAYDWDPIDAYYNDELNIRPGLSIQCCLQFKYDPHGGPVDVTIFGYNAGESAGSVVCSYVPGELPGAPAPYVFPSDPNPQWTTSLPSEGSLDDGVSYVSVDDAERITDVDGAPAVRVYYHFTNNSTSSISLYDAVYLYTYQDGIELFITTGAPEIESDRALYQEVAPGETVSVSCVFLLRNSDSSIEAEIEASTTYDAVGQTYEIR